MQGRARNGVIVAAIAAFAVAVAVTVGAQQPPATPPPANQTPPQTPPAGEHGGQTVPQPQQPPNAQGQRRDFPRFPAHQRPPADPAVLARGKAIYASACGACHGADARGGQLGGVNLLRSQLVLNDKDGELISPVVLQGRPGTQMPPIPLPPDDIKAIAAFVHDLQAKGSNQGGPPESEQAIVLNILVGDARAGGRYFATRCGSCHSPTGDLQGIGSRYADAKVLQNTWVSGGAARARGQGGGQGGGGWGGRGPQERQVTTAAITLPSGEKVEGRLVRIDDFLVSIAQADGTQRSFRREGDVPKIEIKDPLAGHKALLGELTNKDMHDVTAYLASLK
jgi:cytochrome c oxidase cbb3-type subunit III